MRKFLAFFSVFTLSALAMANGSNKKLVIQESAKSEAPTTKRYRQFDTGLVFWQEPIRAKKGIESVDIMTQSLGVNVGITFNNQSAPRSRWRSIWGFDFSAGTIKGRAQHFSITDEFEKQNWVAITSTSGYFYRTTQVTDIGFIVPVIARYINWDLSGNSTLELDRETSFSAGYGIVYMQRLNDGDSINISITHQYIYHATVWALAWKQTL